MDELEELRAENERLRHIAAGGATVVIGGEPGQSIEADLRDAVDNARTKVDKQQQLLDAAHTAVEQAEAALAAHTESEQ